MRIETGIARLTADPELKVVNGKNGEVAIATFNVAKDFGFGDNKKPNFIQVQFFGKKAEVVAKHFKKGNRITVFGELEFDQWEKDGAKHSKHRIRGLDFEFVDYKEDAPAADAGKTDDKSDAGKTDDDENPFAE